jgi:hypothetical protein
MMRFEIFDQIFQSINLTLLTIKYFKYDAGFDLFDLRAALQEDDIKPLLSGKSWLD